MQITLRYLRRGSRETETLLITPADYFDPLEAGETWDANGVPRFDHAHQYLPDALDLEWTELRAPLRSVMGTVREVFSSSGDVTHWHRTDDDGYEGLCVSSRLGPHSEHIVQLQRKAPGPWALRFSTVITDHPDGSQTEVVLATGPVAPSAA